MDGLLHDVRYAVRSLRKSPGFALTVVLTLGLSIGATTAVFAIVDQTILRLPPFAFASRLVTVFDSNRAKGGGGSSLTPEKIVGWQASSLFERLEGYSPRQVDLTGSGEPERAFGVVATTGLFPMLGVQPALGRTFVAEDGGTASHVVIISNELWRRRFGAAPDVLSRTLNIDDQPYTIIGVMPRRFHLLAAGPDSEVFWLPVDVAHPLPEYAAPQYYGLGRLAAGVSIEVAQERANLLADRYQLTHPLPRTWDVRLVPKTVSSVPGTSKTLLWVLMGAVAFVLLIACANVANLLLAHMTGRERDTAVRAALGASRGRLIQQTLVESVLVSGIGGAVGLLLASWGVHLAVGLAPTSLGFLKTTDIQIDGRILAVAALLTTAVGMLVGVVPALRGSGLNLEQALRTTRGTSRSASMSSAAVVVEVALALMLVVATGLMTRTFARLHTIEPGFDVHHLATVRIALPSDRYPTEVTRFAFIDNLSRHLRALTSVSAVTVADYAGPPGVAVISWGVEGDGSATAPENKTLFAGNTVAPNFFRTLGIPVVEGRAFAEQDGSDVTMISRNVATYFWPGQSALGRRLRFGATEPWLTIVGVVGTVELRMGDQRVPLQIYSPLIAPRASAAPLPPTRRRTYSSFVLTVRADDASALLPAIKAQIHAIDPNQPVDTFTLVEDLWAEAFGRQRFALLLMAIFAAIALCLASAGVFAVLSQFVAERATEVGIRMALGARSVDVVRLIVGRGLTLTAIGTTVGLAGALATSRLLSSLLYETSPRDPVSMGAAAGVLFAVASSACWLPALRAARVDPMVALRAE